MISSSSRSVAAIVPVLDGREELERCLPALLAAARLEEVIVVDDGSTDGSAEVAARFDGVRVVTTGARASGPAHARNVGAKEATSEVLAFVDADVLVHRDTIELLLASLDEDGLVAAYGAYDDIPEHRSFASLYMNLRHHHGHREPSADASTFWSGIGVMRRSVFEAAGGFDAAKYPFPSIEDIDLGRRVRAAGGRIRRVPSARGTHLKRWTLASVIHTDVARRARPWSELLVRYPDDFADLNVQGAERAKAVLALVFVASSLAVLVGWAPGWIPLTLLAVVIVASGSFFGVFLRGGGPLFAVAAILFHQLYFVYSTATYAVTLVFGVAERGARPAP